MKTNIILPIEICSHTAPDTGHTHLKAVKTHQLHIPPSTISSVRKIYLEYILLGFKTFV